MEKELMRIAKALEGIEKELHQLNKKMEPKGQNIEELSLAVENRLLSSIETREGSYQQGGKTDAIKKYSSKEVKKKHIKCFVKIPREEVETFHREFRAFKEDLAKNDIDVSFEIVYDSTDSTVS